MPEGYTGVSLIAHTGAAERIVLPVVAVLGVTTATSLQHTSNLFDSLTPSANEVASIALAERASVAPIAYSSDRGQRFHSDGGHHCALMADSFSHALGALPSMS